MDEIFRSPKVVAAATVRSRDVLVIGTTFLPKPNPGFGLLGRLDARKPFDFSIVDITCEMAFPYPQDEVLAAVTAVGAFGKGFGRVITFGSSLGGFIAMNFATHFGAEIAIAGSPPFTLDPAKAPFEPRWDEHRKAMTSFPWDDIATGLAALRAVYVLYNPRGNDPAHVASIEKLARRTVRLPVPFGGHPVTDVLHEAGVLGEVVTAIVGDALTPASFRTMLRAARRRSPTYLRRLAKQQRKRRNALHVRLLEMAYALDPAVETLLEMFTPLYRLRKVDEAVKVAERIAGQVAGMKTEIKALRAKVAALEAAPDAQAALDGRRLPPD